MARMKLKSGVLDQFKGTPHAEYEFGNPTRIKGYNGSGKSTVYDAYTYTFGGYDSSLNPKPVLFPDYMEESTPSVTWICDIDGIEHSIRKYQQDGRTRKEIEEDLPKTKRNYYEVDGVPKNEKVFLKWMEEHGLPDPKTFMLLTHTDILVDKTEDECKNILFGMTSDITDEDIAKSVAGGEIILEELSKKSLSDIKKVARRQLKETVELREAIPQQIQGMEQSKVHIDTAEFEAQKETLKNEVKAMEEKLMEMRIPPISELNEELARLDQEQRMLTAEANSERVAKLTEANAVIGDLKQKLRDMVDEKDRLARNIEEKVFLGNDLGKQYESLAEAYQRTKNSEFDATALVCPTCGQDLPIKEIDRLHKKFEENKRTEMDRLNNEARDVRNRANTIRQELPELQKQLSAMDEQITDMQKDIDDRCAERVKWETPIDASGTPESKNILKRIAEVHHRMNNRDELQKQADQILAMKRDKEDAIRDIDRTLGKLDVNKQIDANIEEKKRKKKEYIQTEANLQRIMDIADEVMRKKAELLTNEVNKHFKIVKFKLFDRKADGDYKSCCVPMIRNENGEYRELGKSANTALGIRGKLDIISGLQNFYDQHLPVFVDGFEALDEENAKLIHMDTQLITLSVSEEPLTVRSE